ncbi:MAG: EAL domain-containing protein [Deltaproteobacteria bacterium]|nr:EAL domain-containing protein [Deltaproteobacteria bacterium]
MNDTAPPCRVLLVDDDAILRLLALTALEGAGFEVVEACDGVAGVEAFAARAPDIVVLDVMMPGMDGYEVCKRIRSMPSGANVPIMVMTGLDDAASIDAAYDAGATDFVTKPINYGLLVRRLRYLMRAASAVRDARDSSRRLGRAQQLARLAQWEMCLDTHQIRWSPEAEALFGVPIAEVAGEISQILRFVHPADRTRVQTAFLSQKAHQLEYRILVPGGGERTLRQNAELHHDVETGTTLLSGAAQDVTDLREAEKRVHDLAYFDTLTGLPNRAYLTTFLTHALEEAQREQSVLAVLSLDLDGFKRVNDTLGHAAGDALLKEVSWRIATCIRSVDDPEDREMWSRSIEMQLTAGDIASRLGGDEFVVVLSRLSSRDEAAKVAERVAERLGRMYTIAGKEVFISSSIGIACFPDAGDDLTSLLERADAAMYYAKESGRNQYQFFNADIQDKARHRLALENALRVSLSRTGIHPSRRSQIESGELRLEYQPKVEIPSGLVRGAEALLRWRSLDLGPISPGDFVPIAEETGLIVPLGEWVLRTACEQAREWSERAPERALRVAVNVSARQFRDVGFAELVAKTLREVGLRPDLLELEITEGLLMQDTVGSVKVLDDLKKLGVRIALDDFGTGYSSLGYLAHLPIDVIKIDRSFIRDLDDSNKSATITSAIIGLSRGLDLEIVVEGVETKSQLDFIARHGTAEIQGYFFAKPMPANRLDEWLDAWCGVTRVDRAA